MRAGPLPTGVSGHTASRLFATGNNPAGPFSKTNARRTARDQAQSRAGTNLLSRSPPRNCVPAVFPLGRLPTANPASRVSSAVIGTAGPRSIDSTIHGVGSRYSRGDSGGEPARRRGNRGRVLRRLAARKAQDVAPRCDAQRARAPQFQQLALRSGADSFCSPPSSRGKPAASHNSLG